MLYGADPQRSEGEGSILEFGLNLKEGLLSLDFILERQLTAAALTDLATVVCAAVLLI